MGLEAFAAERTHGATTCARLAIECFREDPNDREHIADELERIQPGMANIHYIAEQCRRSKDLGATLDQLEEQLASAIGRIAVKAQQLGAKRVATISRSGTVEAALGGVEVVPIEEADQVWVGADQITPTTFVNAVGTKELCESGLPVYVLADRMKEVAQELPFDERFESIPRSLITEWIHD